MFGFLKKKEKWPKQSEFITSLISPKYQEPLTRLVDIIKHDSSGYEERKRTVRVAYVAAKDWFENDMEVRFPDFDQYICNAVRPFLWDQDRLPSDRRRVPRNGEAAKKPVMKVVDDFDRIWYKDYPDINGVVVVDRDGKSLTKEDLVKMGWRIPDGNSLTSQEFAQQVQADTLSRRSSDLPKDVCDLGRMRRIPGASFKLELPKDTAAQKTGGTLTIETTPKSDDLAKEIGLTAQREALLKFRAYLKKRPYRAEMDGNPGQEQRYVNSYFLYEYLDVMLEDIERELKKETSNEQPA